MSFRAKRRSRAVEEPPHFARTATKAGCPIFAAKRLKVRHSNNARTVRPKYRPSAYLCPAQSVLQRCLPNAASPPAVAGIRPSRTNRAASETRRLLPAVGALQSAASPRQRPRHQRQHQAARPAQLRAGLRDQRTLLDRRRSACIEAPRRRPLLRLRLAPRPRRERNRPGGQAHPRRPRLSRHRGDRSQIDALPRPSRRRRGSSTATPSGPSTTRSPSPPRRPTRSRSTSADSCSGS